MSCLWNFSVSAYGRPGVAQISLSLQDRLGADVNVMLCLCWLAANGCPDLKRGDIIRIQSAVAPIQRDVIGPLRAGRRRAKTSDAGTDGALYERLKAIELEAERLEQALLQAMCQQWLSRPPAQDVAHERAIQSLAQYLGVLGAGVDDVDRHAITDLAVTVLRPSAGSPDGQARPGREDGPPSA